MKTIKKIILLTVACCINITFSQSRVTKKISRNYDNLAYIKTTEILLKVANKGYESVDLYQKLGNSYYFNNNMEEATKWYGKLMAMNEYIDAEYYFRYAQTLKSLEQYKEADKWMQKFYENKPTDSRAKAFKSSKNYLSKIDAVSEKRIEIKNLAINSPLSDFGSVQYKDKLIVASSRGGGKLYKWNRQPFLDLYVVEKDNDAYSKIAAFSEAINTKYHESTATFNLKDSIMYFTRNNYDGKRLGKDATYTNRLQIFRARLQQDNSWAHIEPIGFNSADYSVAHPAINASGTRLYFASDMPGTTGSSDLYVAEVNKGGLLGYPVNLGTIINTEGQETYPFINTKGDLYFASNGFPSLGGLDIYVIRNFEKQYLKGQTRDFKIENLGKPINSAQDDFAYFENLKTKEGFFTSNRKGGKGDDDIYTFTILDKKNIQGVVKDENTGLIIPGATVVLYDAMGKEMDRVIADETAKFSFEVDRKTKEYLVRVYKGTYATDEKRLKINAIDRKTPIELELRRDKQDLTLGDDLAKLLDIPMIYFDLNKANIRKDAAVELQKIIAVMGAHPNMTIEVRSYTDSRATKAYNKTLSAERNKATINYLTEVGKIETSRVSGMGYGESQLVNACADGVKCSESKHQANRRSEFIIKRLSN
ncbi:OmpA family protein [Flavobacteriaceae bacterium MHTCC 0001]